MHTSRTVRVRLGSEKFFFSLGESMRKENAREERVCATVREEAVLTRRRTAASIPAHIHMYYATLRSRMEKRKRQIQCIFNPWTSGWVTPLTFRQLISSFDVPTFKSRTLSRRIRQPGWKWWVATLVLRWKFTNLPENSSRWLSLPNFHPILSMQS